MAALEPVHLRSARELRPWVRPTMHPTELLEASVDEAGPEIGMCVGPDELRGLVGRDVP